MSGVRAKRTGSSAVMAVMLTRRTNEAMTIRFMAVSFVKGFGAIHRIKCKVRTQNGRSPPDMNFSQRNGIIGKSQLASSARAVALRGCFIIRGIPFQWCVLPDVHTIGMVCHKVLRLLLHFELCVDDIV